MRDIKVLDIDSIFDEFLVDYIKTNRGKFNEKEWEEKIPVLYVEFGSTPLDALDGHTPEDYYKDLSGRQLADLLYNHVNEKVPVSDFLCEALISTDCEKELSEFINENNNEELVAYCINILNDKNSVIAFDKYYDLLLSDNTCEDMKELIAENLANNPEEAKEGALKCYEDAGSSRVYLLEVLSRCKHDDRIYNILLRELKSHKKDIPLYLSYVTKYGDEKALAELLELIEDNEIDYVAFRELKFAIELFGGEYKKQRDFSNDKYYNRIKDFKNETDSDKDKN